MGLVEPVPTTRCTSTVWQEKTHWESYYRGVEHEVASAVPHSGYMDGGFGLEDIPQHFEPHTRLGGGGSGG